MLWTFRRSERDVVNLYNSLSPVMQLATCGNMLNFGYWDDSTADPLTAQRNLCLLVDNVAELDSAARLIYIGSFLGGPSDLLKSIHHRLDIVCININFSQLQDAARQIAVENPEANSIVLSLPRKDHTISPVNATCTALPLSDGSADRIIALESAQHFKPLGQFLRECKRVLAPGGIMVLAVPVLRKRYSLGAGPKLGILSITWSSEHYPEDKLKSAIVENGFKIDRMTRIGHLVYEPLANYYMQNRAVLKQKIQAMYPPIVEDILCRSIAKMRSVSESEIIDYVVIKASS